MKYFASPETCQKIFHPTTFKVYGTRYTLCGQIVQPEGIYGITNPWLEVGKIPEGARICKLCDERMWSIIEW